MPINGAFNAAIINGPSIMAMGLAVPRGGAEREIICGRTPENDEQRARLQQLRASNRCGSSTGESPFRISPRMLSPVAGVSDALSAPSLRYTPSISRRRVNLGQFVERTRDTDPAGAAKMAELFASTDVIVSIGRDLTPYGLRTDNVADAYAAWWMTAWQAAHGDRSDPSRKTAESVRTQAAASLAGTPERRNFAPRPTPSSRNSRKRSWSKRR